MQVDVFGEAIRDYHKSGSDERILTFSSLEEEDSFPVSYLFRSYNDMPDLEKEALNLCKGRVLDVGCGAGSHSLYLCSKGFEVTAIDISPGAVEVCRTRGIPEVEQADFWTYEGDGFDTLLLLMNGIGIVGHLSRLAAFFEKARELLSPSGQILFDSSDIIYMYDETEDGGFLIPAEKSYYGEVTFEVQYKTLKSAPFPWLYVDFETLSRAALINGFSCELVRKGDHYDYLAKLTVQA